MKQAFIFPGQGSQLIGMGKDLAATYPEARRVFDEVDSALGESLSSLMFEGDEAQLDLTENTQPALMAVSIAVVEVLKARGFPVQSQCAFVAGHSLGEYAALTAAGSLALSDTARLLKLRGLAMQKAVPVGEGSMAAILGLSLEDVQDIANGLCEVANDNSVGQVVISGSVSGVNAAVARASERGAKRAVILPVSAPFHCTLMTPAAEAMREALSSTQINAPSVPVVANVTAAAVSDPEQIRQLLVDQATGMVRWRESVLYMRDQGVTSMTELGAGNVLSGLVHRIDKDIACQSIGTAEQIERFLQN